MSKFKLKNAKVRIFDILIFDLDILFDIWNSSFDIN